MPIPVLTRTALLLSLMLITCAERAQASESTRMTQVDAPAGTLRSDVSQTESDRFQRECESRLEPTEVRAISLPSAVLYEFGVPVTLLTRLGARQHGLNQAVVGLTEYVLKHKIAWSGGTLVSSTGLACTRPHLTLTLEVGPQRVYVAREFPQGTCAFNDIARHELRHVYANQEGIEAAASALQQEMEAYYGNRIFYGDKASLRAQMEKEVRQTWLPRLQDQMKAIDLRHNDIDSPQEYLRNQSICDGAIPKALRALEPR